MSSANMSSQWYCLDISEKYFPFKTVNIWMQIVMSLFWNHNIEKLLRRSCIEVKKTSYQYVYLSQTWLKYHKYCHMHIAICTGICVNLCNPYNLAYMYQKMTHIQEVRPLNTWSALVRLLDYLYCFPISIGKK